MFSYIKSYKVGKELWISRWKSWQVQRVGESRGRWWGAANLVRNGGCGLLIRGSPSHLPLIEWEGLVCCPISSYTYKALPFLHGQASIEGRNGKWLLNQSLLDWKVPVMGGMGPGEWKEPVGGRIGVISVLSPQWDEHVTVRLNQDCVFITALWRGWAVWWYGGIWEITENWTGGFVQKLGVQYRARKKKSLSGHLYFYEYLLFVSFSNTVFYLWTVFRQLVSVY